MHNSCYLNSSLNCLWLNCLFITEKFGSGDGGLWEVLLEFACSMFLLANTSKTYVSVLSIQHVFVCVCVQPQNRFKVPVDTKFYRVKAKAWSPGGSSSSWKAPPHCEKLPPSSGSRADENAQLLPVVCHFLWVVVYSLWPTPSCVLFSLTGGVLFGWVLVARRGTPVVNYSVLLQVTWWFITGGVIIMDYTHYVSVDGCIRIYPPPNHFFF